MPLRSSLARVGLLACLALGPALEFPARGDDVTALPVASAPAAPGALAASERPPATSGPVSGGAIASGSGTSGSASGSPGLPSSGNSSPRVPSSGAVVEEPSTAAVAPAAARYVFRLGPNGIGPGQTGARAGPNDNEPILRESGSGEAEIFDFAGCDTDSWLAGGFSTPSLSGSLSDGEGALFGGDGLSNGTGERCGPNDNEPILRTGPNDNEPILYSARLGSGRVLTLELRTDYPEPARIVFDWLIPDIHGAASPLAGLSSMRVAELSLHAEGVSATPIERSTGLFLQTCEIDLLALGQRLGVDFLSPDHGRVAFSARLFAESDGQRVASTSVEVLVGDTPLLDVFVPGVLTPTSPPPAAAALAEVFAVIRARPDADHFVALASDSADDLRALSPGDLAAAFSRCRVLGAGRLITGRDTVIRLDELARNGTGPRHVLIWTLSESSGWSRSRAYRIR